MTDFHKSLDRALAAKPREFWWQLLAELVTPPITLALAVAQPFRQKERDVMGYYDPPDTDESERYWYCDNCDEDTLHLFLYWRSDGTATRECLTCELVSDFDADDYYEGP